MARIQPLVTSDRWRGLRVWGTAVVIVVMLSLAYARVGFADFNWDDDAHITANPVITGPGGLKEIWTSAKANYFPLTMTSFWVQHALWGLRPGAFHVVTGLFHLAAALMLWRVLLRLRIPGAGLGAMLWALHPVQVESVAWICELKNTQSGFFYLLSILAFLRWMSPAGPLRFGRDYGWALLAAMAAVLSKSSTVMLPVVLGLAGWWLGRRRWQEAVWLAPFFALSLVASGWTIWEQKVNSMASGAEWGHGLAARFLIAGQVPWFYLGKLAWPEPLVFIYPRWNANAFGWVHALPLALALGSAFALWRFRSTGAGRALIFALGYFVVSLFPVLGFFDVFFFRYSFVGDHLQYLASMGPLVLLGAVMTTALRSGRPWSGFAGYAAAGVVGALALLTYQQTKIYHTRETLWQDTVRLNPGAWIARMNFGHELLATGRAEPAIEQFQAALALKPDDALAMLNWGTALITLGRNAEAVAHLETAIRRMPRLVEAHDNLGVALAALGRLPEAAESFRKALALNPNLTLARQRLADTHYHLGHARAVAGQTAEALPHLEEAARLHPEHAAARADLGAVLYQLKRLPEAIVHLEAAVKLQPQSAVNRNNLGSALTQSGRLREAIAEYRAALQFEPGYHEARVNLAGALAAAGEAEAAMRELEQVLQSQPDHASARAQLAYIRARQDRPAAPR